MKKVFLLIVFVQLILGVFAQLTDDQIVKLLQNAQKQGMSQQEMVMMLMQKGVTKEQLLRLKEQYIGRDGTLQNENTLSGSAIDRMRGKAVSSSKSGTKKEGQTEKEVKPGMQDMLLQNQGLMTDTSLMNLATVLDEKQQAADKLKKREKEVFGKDVFNNTALTFEPNLNIPTPENYILGPGDEVIVDIWGDAEETIRERISPDGNIIVEKVGPIYLSGLTVKEANTRLKNTFSQIYSTLEGANPTSYLQLSLGQIRSIIVNVMGEVAAPGTYTLPSLASVFHALYSAGGINEIGSLRSVKVNRGGKEIAHIDVYQYLIEGKSDMNVSLRDGDVIVVPPYQNLVTVKGKVKRPMIYELKDNEHVDRLLSYAGNFRGDAYKKAVRVVRKSGREYQVYNIEEEKYGNFVLVDGDEVSVDSVLPRFQNRVEVRGAVYRPGMYDVGHSISTVKELVDKAEGIKGDAFMNRAVLYREKPDFTLEVKAIDIAGILNGNTPDVELRNNDVLYIPSIFDLQEDYTVTVRGAVGFPGTYKYASGMELEDLIIQAGGLIEAASTVKVDVARRIKSPKSTTVGNMLAENFTFTLKDGLKIEGKADFTLQPFDEIYVRTSPGYKIQQNVRVEGEVLFEGTYVLAAKGERLSDLVKKAGGLTPEAYIAGARLERRMNPDERAKVETVLKLARQGGRDSIDVNRLDIGDTYYVGIQLGKALKHPYEDDDIVLREGDRLVVPQYSNTVKISGGVMYPNTVVYQQKAKLKHYIEQGGGFASRARRGKVFIVYMNGTVAKSRTFAKAKAAPGCEIVVPVKPPRKGLGLAEILSLTNSTTSMAAMVTSIINSTK